MTTELLLWQMEIVYQWLQTVKWFLSHITLITPHLPLCLATEWCSWAPLFSAGAPSWRWINYWTFFPQLNIYNCDACGKYDIIYCVFLPQGWLKKRSPQEAETLRQLFSSSFSDMYRFSVQSLEFKMDMLEAFVIMQCINMLQGLIPPKVMVQHVSFVCRNCLWLNSFLHQVKKWNLTVRKYMNVSLYTQWNVKQVDAEEPGCCSKTHFFNNKKSSSTQSHYTKGGPGLFQGQVCQSKTKKEPKLWELFKDLCEVFLSNPRSEEDYYIFFNSKKIK